LAHRKFYAAGTYGFFGYIFVDLIAHEFVVERQKPNVPTKVGQETPSRDITNVTTKRGDDGKAWEIVTKKEKYSHIMLANTSPLPPNILKDRRRKMRVSPVLSVLRALWEFEGTNTRYPTMADLQQFKQLASEKHAELQLPPETLKDELIKNFLQGLEEYEVPVTAFLGGLAAQDVINVLGKRQQPIQNFMIFDGEEMQGPIYALHPTSHDLISNGVNGGSAPAPVPAGILIE
jgi:ubiquitin-like 1-activating enzyme E1 A